MSQKDKNIEYTLRLEDDMKLGDVLIYWGWAHFYCNFDTGEYPSQQFVVMFARVAFKQTAHDLSAFAIGFAARDKKKGDVIVWNPRQNTEDVVIGLESEIKPDHITKPFPFLQDPNLPPNVHVTQNGLNPEDKT